MIFASVLAAALRPNAELLLNELQDSCALAGITGQHDGYAMLKAMRLKAALHSVIQDLSARFHESAWESMRDQKLPNGCSSQMFSDKVNTLLKDHLPHLESVDLTGTKLSKAIVNFMPAACATEGRALMRELVKATRPLMTKSRSSTVARRSSLKMPMSAWSTQSWQLV